MVEHGAQLAPEDFLPRGDDDVTIRGREGLPRNRIVVRRAGRLGHLAIGQPHGADVAQQMQHGVEHRDLDPAPLPVSFAVEQRRQYPLARINPAAEIGERNADAHRRTAGLAGDGHMAADRLDVEVERRIVLVFAGAAEAGNGALDDTRIDAVQRRIIDCEAFEHARAKVVDHDIGYFYQLVEQLAPGRILEVEYDALFVAVERQKQAAPPFVGSNRRISAEIALGGLHLDHLGAKVGQHLAAVGAGDDLAELQYPDALKRMRHRSQSQSARDDVALNLRGARPDNGEARIAKEALHWIFHAVAVTAENLQAKVGDRLIGLTGIELEHRRVLTCRGPLRHQPCEAVDQRARNIEHDLHVRELVRDRLEFTDRPSELLAALGVIESVFKRRGGRAGARGGKAEPLVP